MPNENEDAPNVVIIKWEREYRKATKAENISEAKNARVFNLLLSHCSL